MIGSANKTEGYGITVHKEKGRHQLKNIKIGHKNQKKTKKYQSTRMRKEKKGSINDQPES
jgi:hypothetical protein